VIGAILQKWKKMSEENRLTVADALSELKRIKKLLVNRNQNISRYCSKRRGGKDEIENQKKFIESEFQSAKDLITRYKNIKLAINKSNLETILEFGGKTFSVADAILFKQQFYEMNKELLNAFMPNTGISQVNQYIQSLGGIGHQFTEEQMQKLDLVPELLYDEKVILKAKEDDLNLYSFVDALIEKSNHNTYISL